MASARRVSNNEEDTGFTTPFVIQKGTVYAVGSLIALLLLLFAWLALDGRSDNGGKGVSSDLSSADIPASGSSGTAIAAPNGMPDIRMVIDEVQKHFVFPPDAGEVGVVVITDIESLRNAHPGWYDRAKTGDLLIAYNRGVIIFDPNVGKIVDLLRLIQEQE